MTRQLTMVGNRPERNIMQNESNILEDLKKFTNHLNQLDDKGEVLKAALLEIVTLACHQNNLRPRVGNDWFCPANHDHKPSFFIHKQYKEWELLDDEIIN